ncbi:MAG TPA: DoxX family protein [Piscinibacter sp.]|jgi:putative oxidoreductase|uniref:DoxX family protein n=1 Tax=Piscinibacter sp. TaxID=1903157 RepID=UPI001B698DBC|nr:DoxX family protein [Piscinibacter sp.]MBK7532197.1 DoxX family protein [Piscinibacter sp.]MBL0094761.1 DoxX family protein [Piscinibacter sp.]MBP6542122.1 DoxX family protein [Piscinibacter sp.]HOY37099.1 DoxX family protein [Piscinibacter sp.]HPG78403.1 DoxX family protein [Piscinibacter sp.]
MIDSFKTPLVIVGRVLLALMFIYAGFGKLTNLEGTAGYIASGGLPMASVLAVVVGLLELLGGLAIAVGLQARWAALALGLFTLAASVLFHKFWAVPADQAFVQQLMFMKNLSVAGGLFIVAALGAGPVSVDARRGLVPATA